ncbi:MAG: hypothetical protein CVV50_05060 [Spirochaetae bacterium HGW-Spirochaetae-6]|nr:MAG: hypothetical protein CVV50_05060 [Spirochaetae bacterium HGW-Spirochaetae-6]
MKKLPLILFLLFPLGLFSFDWKKAGYEILEQKNASDSSFQILIVADANKRNFEIKFQQELNPAQIQILMDLKERFYGWSNLRIKSLSFIVWQDKISVSLLPDEFIYEGQNLARVIPGGLFFYWQQNKLFYEFRVQEGETFLKLKGELRDNEGFFAKMKAPGPAFEEQKKQEELMKAIVEEEFKKELQKDISQEPEKKDAADEKKEEQTIFFGFSIFAGSGALGSLSVDLDLGWLILSPAAGFTLYYPDSSDPNIKAMGVPLGMRVAVPILDAVVVRPYLLGAVYYGLEIENYESQFIWLAGAGTYFLRYFFTEGSYLSNQNGQGFVFGLGMRFIF